jgi:Carboxypeptidase regulatory-like domain
MSTERLRKGSVLGALLLALLPGIAAGQGGDLGTIAGVVKDSTGGVLPGVTVEVSSPALIEKVRSAATDGQGQYKIISLRPGLYDVAFTLEGFGTVKRTGVELTAAFTATVNAELKPGTLEESITVSGQSPLVDVQNTVQQRAVTAAVIEALPAGRQFQGFAVLVPGVTRTGAQDVGGSSGDNFSSLAVHGSHSGEMPLIFDGMRYNNMNGSGGGGLHNFQINSGAVQEMAIQTAGASVENQVSGVFVNVIPKDGSNTLRGDFYVTGANKSFQSNNLTDEIKAAGLSNVTTINKIWDVNPGVGGPIKQDRVWFHTSVRYWGNIQDVGGMWYNSTVNTPLFTPDLARPATAGDTWLFDANLRLTLQASPKNKFTVYYDNSQRLIARRNTSPTLAPEATERYSTPRNGLYQFSWSSPRTNRLLFEAGGTIYPSTFTTCTQPSGGPGCQPEVLPSAIGIRDVGTGISYGAVNGRPLFRDRSNDTNIKASVAYVTGSHALKFGMQMIYGYHERPTWVLNDMYYQFLNTVPRSLTEWSTPYNTIDKLSPSPSFYIQDQWTMTRLTTTMGLRLDTLYGYVPAISLPATRFVPARNFAEVDNLPHWEDLSPRVGVAYDLFGNGKTAIKGSINRYVQSQTLALANANNPVVTSVLSATRTWSDSNKNYVPDCNFSILDGNGECGPISDRNFGQTNPKATTYDPDLLNGFQKRPNDWEIETSVTQELRPGVAASAAYFRHWFGNQYATRNTVLTPADFDTFCVAAPVDARLPGGGGNKICGLYDAKVGKFGTGTNEVTFAKNFGDPTELFSGVDININARLRGGAFLQGGTSIGRLTTDTCFANDLPQLTPQISGANVTTPKSDAYCHVAPPLAAGSQVKFAGTYNLPWRITAAATYQNVPGIAVAANYAVPTASVNAALGRNPNASVSAPLITPSSVYTSRINQLDFRGTRAFQFGRTRLRAHIDLYNLFNTSGIQGQNSTYGSQWLTPTSIVQGRLLKLAAQIDW